MYYQRAWVDNNNIIKEITIYGEIHSRTSCNYEFEKAVYNMYLYGSSCGIDFPLPNFYQGYVDYKGLPLGSAAQSVFSTYIQKK